MNVELPETLVIIESVVYKSNGFAIYWVSEERNEAIPNCKRIASFLGSDMMVLIDVHRPLLKKLNKSRVPGRAPGTLIYRYPPCWTIAFKI
jgi:hypothetical protein